MAEAANMVGGTRIELVTPSMSTKCSTAELTARLPLLNPAPQINGARNSAPVERSIKGVASRIKGFCNLYISVYVVSEGAQMSPIAYDLHMPDKITSCVVFASPHSGRCYSPEFLRKSVLDPAAIRSSEDAFVDQLYRAAPRYGSPFITARAPRAFVDLNRSADELDPALIDDMRGGGHSPRVASGLGVVPRVVANGRCIYNGKLTFAEVEQRLYDHWYPYHNRLQTLLDESRAIFGRAILIDCHSMPREAVMGHLKSSRKRPDIVLGDRFGSSAAAGLVDQIDAAFQSEGFRTARNTPFAGAFITQHYGRPQKGQSAVQIEIDRSLYMDEARLKPNADFETVQARLSSVAAQIARLGRPDAMPLAAE